MGVRVDNEHSSTSRTRDRESQAGCAEPCVPVRPHEAPKKDCGSIGHAPIYFLTFELHPWCHTVLLDERPLFRLRVTWPVGICGEALCHK